MATVPGNYQTRFLLATALLQTGQSAEAEKYFRGLIRDEPSQVGAYNNLAISLYRQNQAEKAIEVLQQGLQSSATYATAYQNLTKIYNRMASDAYRKALTQVANHDADEGPTLTLAFATDETPTLVPADPIAANGETPTPPNAESVNETLQAWARAWSEQDVNGYLNHYAADFVRPARVNRRDWEQYRRARLRAPNYIKVKVSEVEVQFFSPRHCRVLFQQDYQSNTFNEKSAKAMLMTRVGEDWRITLETELR